MVKIASSLDTITTHLIRNNMNQMIYVLMVATMASVSCTNLPFLNRQPSGQQDLQSVYLNKLDIDVTDEHVNYLMAAQQRKVRVQSTEMDLNFVDPVETEIKKLKSELEFKKSKFQNAQSLTEASRDLEPHFSNFSEKWRMAKQTFVLHDLAKYEIPRTQTYQLSEAKETELSLHNYFYSWAHNRGSVAQTNNALNFQNGEQQNQHYLETEITCDGAYKFNGQNRSAHEVKKLKWYDQATIDQRTTLTLNSETKDCTIKFLDPITKKSGRVTFKPDTGSYIDQFSARFETCVQEDTALLSGPEKFFYGARNSRLTCPVAVTGYQSLPTPQDTIETKIETLIGQKVPETFWTARTPFYQFDMGKAPKFDAIFISYLVFRNDFFGRTIAELLKWHAQHGTEIYIINSKVIAHTKDSQMLLDMMAEYPQVHVQEFAYATRTGLGLKDMFDQLHRTLHSKMFITYSKTNPKLNKAWIGGRNIHDGFAFEKMPLPISNDIIDYSKDDSWAFWRDFEAIIFDKNFIEQIISQYATLWNRDGTSLFVRDSVLNLNSKKQMQTQDIDLNKPVARHILTIPYSDNMNLESFISSMIDSAEKEILFSTPYFRPTQKIATAFTNAIKRGVKVKMITRLDLKGDTIDWLLSDVNKAGVNQFLNQIEMYEYTAQNEILHSKIFLIDNKLTFFGGVNLNKRSFYHDIENGILTLGSAYNSEVTQVFKTYFDKSKKISEKQKTAYWKQIIIGVFDKEF